MHVWSSHILVAEYDIHQPGKVANPGKNNISVSSFAPENLVSRDRFGRPVPRQPPRSPYVLGLNLVVVLDSNPVLVQRLLL